MLLAAAVGTAKAEIESYLLFDMADGTILAQHRPTALWYPASITKLMTAYVTFDQIRKGHLKMTSPVTISAQASQQPPSKMGFPVGTVITIETALRIILTKSANDVSVALAESVGGTQQGFIDAMNDTAVSLGMIDSHFDNPHGLPNTKQVTTARDIAVLMMALQTDFPEYADFFKMSGVQLGKRRHVNHNALIRRFRGADGMKTGFICASGFNIAASATRDGRRLGAVVLGALTSNERNQRTAELLSKGFIALENGGVVALDGFDPDVKSGSLLGPLFVASEDDPHPYLSVATVSGTRPDLGTVAELAPSSDAVAENRLPQVCTRPRPKTRYSGGLAPNLAAVEANRAAMVEYAKTLKARDDALSAQLAAPLEAPLRGTDTRPATALARPAQISHPLNASLERAMADAELRPADWTTLRRQPLPAPRPIVLASGGPVWSRETASDLAPEGWAPAPLAAPWRHPLAGLSSREVPEAKLPATQPLGYLAPPRSIAAVPIRIGGADETRPEPFSGPIVGGGPPPQPQPKPQKQELAQPVDPASIIGHAVDVRNDVAPTDG